MTNREIKNKDLSKNALMIKNELKVLKFDTKLISAKDMNTLVMKTLGCSIRTAQRTIKELEKNKKIAQPKVYRVTLRY